MKRKNKLILALLLCAALILAGCTSKPAEQAQPQTEPETTQQAGAEENQTNEPQQPQDAQPGGETQSVQPEPAGPSEDFEEENAAAREAYMRALQEFVVLGELPDGTSVPYEPAYDEEHADKYTIWDIDEDGRDELILRASESIMAGMVEQIWGYDAASGELKLEFTGFPDCWYTRDGNEGPAAMSPYSHGSGMESDDFWNYHVSIYNPETDTYDYLASVEQLSKAAMEQMGRADEFPGIEDIDGNGIVYVINYNWGETIDTLDDMRYEMWRNLYEGGEKMGYALILDWQPTSDFVHPNGDPVPVGSL